MLGTDAAYVYLANLDVFLTALAGILHATALIASAGGPVADAVADLYEHLQLIPAMIGPSAELAADLVAGHHPGDLSNVIMMGATADHIVEASAESGVARGSRTRSRISTTPRSAPDTGSTTGRACSK